MRLRLNLPILFLYAMTASGQAGPVKPSFDAFDAATVKPVDADHPEAGRYFRMQGTNRFVAVNYTLKLLIAAAYDLNPKAVSGGAEWMNTEKFDIAARTPGEVAPERREQMQMLRALLTEQFGLRFHREPREFSLYALEVAKGGTKLRSATELPETAPRVISTVFPNRVELPARNVTMEDFTAMMQRSLLDRPVVDRTGLAGRFDFDLHWAPDATQLEGDGREAGEDAQDPPLFTALQQQLGLRLEATRGTVSALVIEAAHRPTAE